MDDREPLVSVVITTFNHDAYIEQALRSVATQVTPFDIEILVGEDHSKDETAEIASRVAREFPNRVRLFLHPENLGGHANFDFLWSRARGKYIAWLEGDDFWTDRTKLKRQVQALEATPEATFCFHNAAVLQPRESRISNPYPGLKKQSLLAFEDMISYNGIMTSSVMYRRGVVARMPAWIHGLKVGDWPLHLVHAIHGKAVFLPRVMSTYRVHAGGVWTARPFFGAGQ
ncbi:MAG: glycosyltransferase [Methylovirgula sp.]